MQRDVAQKNNAGDGNSGEQTRSQDTLADPLVDPLADSLADPMVGHALGAGVGTASLQMKRDRVTGLDGESVKAIANEGVRSSGANLPHLDRIQSSFGKYDVSGVKAFTSASAQKASEAVGAKAFTTGQSIAFADSSPDLRTTAHEAAHVVQQRSGVSLSGGVGAEGDRYERHADAVADAVAAGDSAETLLGVEAGTLGGGIGSNKSGLQRKIEGYQKKTKLTERHRVLRDVKKNSDAWNQIVALHSDNDEYSIDRVNEVRQKYKLPIIEQRKGYSGVSKNIGWANRYKGGDPNAIEHFEQLKGALGFSFGEPQERRGQSDEVLTAYSIKDGFHELQNNSYRGVDQNRTIGTHYSEIWDRYTTPSASANDAAKRLKIDRGLDWEWLHVIAYSIGPTHVSSLKFPQKTPH